jgi:DNA polymerase III delta prime subunit
MHDMRIGRVINEKNGEPRVSSTEQSRAPVASIAEDVLATFDLVERAATSALQSDASLTAESLTIANTFTSVRAMQTLDQMNADRMNSSVKLQREPAIARLVVADETGATRTYYVCRTSPPSMSGAALISYRSPVGAMAELNVGDRFRLQRGAVVELRQRALLHPFKQDTWDSRNTVLESDSFGTLTVLSLRELLSPAGVEFDDDILAQQLAEDDAAANVIEGIRRNVITKMGLRDQPILDKYQGAIFRMPLSRQLLILGPPGTGKTTTLIRRLGQKLDTTYLDEAERELVRRMEENTEVAHGQSWLMFTPTELLKQYVKEAFAQEGIPAPERRIRTWIDFRHDLARNELSVLRSSAGSGIFVLKDSAVTLALGARDRPTDWFTDFDQWQKHEWLSAIRQAASDLHNHSDESIAAMATKPLELLTKADADGIDEAVVTLSRESRVIQARISDMKAFTDRKVKEALTLQANRNRSFLDELAQFIDTLQDATDSDIDDGEDQDAEEDEDAVEAKTGRAAAMAAYLRCARTQARAQARKRAIKKTSRSGRIAEWLGDRGLPSEDLADVGASLVLQSRARRLVNPATSFIQGIPRRYRGFRRVRQAESSWYAPSGFSVTDLHPLELDIVLLAMLRGAGGLLRRAQVRRDIDQPEWAALRAVRSTIRNQVLVDEATDFSPVQLACMAALANSEARSFFACGDFNQRLTTWGSRTLGDVEWACPGVSSQTISVSYRQSTQLNELAKGIVRLGGGDDSAMLLPEGVDNSGVQPVLVEQLAATGDIVAWLARRIREIEKFVQKMPSIAVLVMDEAQVQPVAEGLSTELADDNILAVPCRDGQTVGKDNDVRVFDIQHIKGLEFEAVFFVGVDQLAVNEPELFDKYLYVGTTRAATYLGITCDGGLPSILEPLRSMFAGDWMRS